MLKQFTIGFSRTVNLGNFESAKVEASVVWSLEDHENVTQAMVDAQVSLRQFLEQTWMKQMKNGKAEK